MNQEYVQTILEKLIELKLGNTPAINLKTIEVFTDCLEDVKPELILLGYKHILKNGTESGFFPSAPEFRKICLQFTQDKPDGKLDKAWKAFKNFVPNLFGSAGEKQAELLNSDPALRRCIEAFHSDWSNSSPDSSSYWYKIFSEAYLKAAQGQQIEATRKRLEGSTSGEMAHLMEGYTL